MNIGQAAAASGVTAKMIRHYESIGLIEPAPRTDAGYRTYGTSDIHTLRFIRSARRLGFSMTVIKELLSLWRDERRTSEQVKAIALPHLDQLRGKVLELQAMIRTLEQLVNECSGDARPDCPILVNLAEGGAARPEGHVENRFGFGRLDVGPSGSSGSISRED